MRESFRRRNGVKRPVRRMRTMSKGVSLHLDGNSVQGKQRKQQLQFEFFCLFAGHQLRNLDLAHVVAQWAISGSIGAGVTSQRDVNRKNIDLFGGRLR